MKKNKIIVIILAITLLILLSACGEKLDGTPFPSSEQESGLLKNQGNFKDVYIPQTNEITYDPSQQNESAKIKFMQKDQKTFSNSLSKLVINNNRVNFYALIRLTNHATDKIGISILVDGVPSMFFVDNSTSETIYYETKFEKDGYLAVPISVPIAIAEKSEHHKLTLLLHKTIDIIPQLNEIKTYCHYPMFDATINLDVLDSTPLNPNIDYTIMNDIKPLNDDDTFDSDTFYITLRKENDFEAKSTFESKFINLNNQDRLEAKFFAPKGEYLVSFIVNGIPQSIFNGNTTAFLNFDQINYFKYTFQLSNLKEDMNNECYFIASPLNQGELQMSQKFVIKQLN